MKTIVFVLLISCSFKISAQFNEQLKNEILTLAKQYQLDSITNPPALLQSIATKPKGELLNQHLVGYWKYSHSVDGTGRQYRSAGVMEYYRFQEGKKIVYKKYNKPEVYERYWKYKPTVSSILLSEHPFDNENEVLGDAQSLEPMQVHSVSRNRLVLVGIVRSKQYPGTYAVTFKVYFNSYN